ncbi:MAG: alkyl sulfatase dimerization domain-containing protein [Gordonibacter sp.]
MDTFEKSPVGRRTFLKGVFATAALSALPITALIGCSQENQNKSKPIESMTQEERAKAVADSTYMGGDTNYYGQKLEMTEGPKGQITPKAPLEWLKWQSEAGAFEKVTDRVYVSHTYPLSNSVMFLGDTGIVILETSGNCESAAKDLKQFRTITDKPVEAIIYSHEHYALGTSTYIPEGNPDNVPIIAHEDIIEQLAYICGPVAPIYGYRSSLQFSAVAPNEGPDAPVMGAVAASDVVETSGFIAPTVIIPRDVPVTEMKLAGLTFQLFPGSSDSPASLSVYCVEEKTLFSNHVMPTFFNMYTLRGESYRDPSPFIKEIDTFHATNAENLIPCLGRVISGRDNVDRELTLYRDGVQFIYDQTIRYMNQGYGPDELTRKVKIPSFLVEGALTMPIYGELEHHIRGIYRGIIGWFGTDVLELHPISKEFESRKIVEAMGGTDAVLAESKRTLEDKQYAWAVTLATYVLNIDPNNKAAREAKAAGLIKMAHVTNSSITRSWYTAASYNLTANSENAVAPFHGMTPDKFPILPHSIMLDHLRVSIDPEKAMDMNESLTITLTDKDVSNTMVVRNCVGAIETGKPASPSAELRMTLPIMASVLIGETKLDDGLSSGEIELVGEKAKLDKILDICDLKL